MTVVDAKQNRAPTNLALTPLSANLPVGAELKLQASASDPDGDALSFSWEVDGVAIVGEPEIAGDSSYLRVKAEKEGVATVFITVTDGKTAPLQAKARLTVGALPTGNVDADKDGWPAGAGRTADCNDSDPNVYPGAMEKCGENVDRNCDGSIRLDDCDYDDQTTAEGDCDDNNPNRKAGLIESCDGLDNDCNQQVDERFSVGKPCQVGKGQCFASGLLECSADGATTICDTLPNPGSPEVCDGIDNDCDGLIDPQPVCGFPTDASVSDASTSTEAGVADAGSPFSPDAGTGTVAVLDASGCVYQGPEYCTDGFDNDCDGAIDFRDTDCPQTPQGESCKDLFPIEIGQWYAGSFDKAIDDFTSRCVSKMPDRVYGFKLQQDGYVSVTVSGAGGFSWSLQEGSCTPEVTQLAELTCGSTSIQNYMKANTPIWLILEGPSGGYEFRVDFALTKG